jgi:hypothetical protein
MVEEIINRVAESSLLQIDLEDFLPKAEVLPYDLAQNLFEGMILKENDFRDFLKNHNWNQYEGKTLAIHCSKDAIVPNWAYMLLATKLNEHKANGLFGSVNEVKEKLLLESFTKSDLGSYNGKKVLVKGCGSFDLSPAVYIEITNQLQPIVNSLMFGEACSSVPVFKSHS